MNSIYPQSYPIPTIINNNNGIIDELNEAKKKLAEFKIISSNIIESDKLIRNYAEKNAECKQLQDKLEQTKLEKSTLNENLKAATWENESLKRINKEVNKAKQKLTKKLDENIAQAKIWEKKEFELKKRLKEVEQERDAKSREVAELNEQIKKLNESHQKTLSQLEETINSKEQAKVVITETTAKILPSEGKSSDTSRAAMFCLNSSLSDLEDESNEPNANESRKEVPSNISLPALSPKKTGNSGTKTASKTRADNNATNNTSSPTKTIAIATPSSKLVQAEESFTLSSSNSDSDREESSSESSSSKISSDEEELIEKKPEMADEGSINISEEELEKQEIEKEEEWRVKRAESEKSEAENILKIQIEEEKKRTISEQVRDKIVNDEVNTTRLCSICVVVSFVCPHREQFLKDVGSDILKSYEHELQNDRIEFRVVQLAIIESLLSLSPFDPQRCMSIIECWISRLNDNARRFLPDLIKTKINVVFTQHNRKFEFVFI